MFHACAARFDVIGNVKKFYKIFWELNKAYLFILHPLFLFYFVKPYDDGFYLLIYTVIKKTILTYNNYQYVRHLFFDFINHTILLDDILPFHFTSSPKNFF